MWPEEAFSALLADYDEAMSSHLWINLLAVLTLDMASAFGDDCVPITQARQHIGKTKCVTGKVVKVTRMQSGTHFLTFCEDYRTCPFQVVIFRSDLKHVGDVRQLEGRIIDVHGDIMDYDGDPRSSSRTQGSSRAGRHAFRRCRRIMMSRKKDDTAREGSSTRKRAENPLPDRKESR